MNRIVTTAMLVAAGAAISACNVSTGSALKVKEGDYNYANYHNDESSHSGGADAPAQGAVASYSGSESHAALTTAGSGNAESGGVSGRSANGISGQSPSGGTGASGSAGNDQAPDKQGNPDEDKGKEADRSQPENGGSASQPNKYSQQDWEGEYRGATFNSHLDKDGAEAEAEANHLNDKDGAADEANPQPDKDGAADAANPEHDKDADKDGNPVSGTASSAHTAGEPDKDAPVGDPSQPLQEENTAPQDTAPQSGNPLAPQSA